jgi:hypothetical protein
MDIRVAMLGKAGRMCAQAVDHEISACAFGVGDKVEEKRFTFGGEGIIQVLMAALLGSVELPLVLPPIMLATIGSTAHHAIGGRIVVAD